MKTKTNLPKIPRKIAALPEIVQLLYVIKNYPGKTRQEYLDMIKTTLTLNKFTDLLWEKIITWADFGKGCKKYELTDRGRAWLHEYGL